MTNSDPVDLDIAALAELIAGREISPLEVTTTYLERIERLDPQLNAFISVHAEAALAAARQAEAEIAAGHYRGPLHGVPLAVKDLFQVAGWERTCGSAFFRDTPRHDSTSVARLKAAGAVLLGLLNLHEFAFGPTGVNPHHGTARNPWDLERVCGGSSSGSGCALAASLVAGALGSDTGGSIRIPAALCGVVGLKQSYGLASRQGIFPLVAAFDHGGPLGRSVRDVAIMLQVIAGPDPADTSTAGAEVTDYVANLDDKVSGRRVGVLVETFADLHPGVDAAVREALGVLAGLGVELIDVAPPRLAEVGRIWNALALPESYQVHATHIATHGAEYSPDVLARLELGRRVPAVDFLEAEIEVREVRAEMAALMAAFDALVAPTAPLPAPAIAGEPEVEGARVLGSLTRLANLTGQPAISLPCGFSDEGLPVGLQLIGRHFGDGELLQLARAYEQATSWHLQRPPGL
ncbi:MAG TPA: amidase [Alphaproteobacteria bacterium]|jgi:aspartyl-tRNA(Asn)/glutamyl-tRNA(Gln) amidotransferase subunit A|nr:amidase [Alphaproteobacteria bacterium]MDP6271609.1 amidase [Alphaproteobacteria bacterium]MDP7427929.1 amidase [Alphaproteobacteria bacterium]HJM51684.1 amidase [Alphaproteobacteria bacterium]